MVAELGDNNVSKTPREFPRTLFSVAFHVQPIHEHAPGAIRAMSVDISQGGLGALVQGSLHVGEKVRIELPIAGRTIKTDAIVRHSSALRSGFQFLELTKNDRQDIKKLSGRA